MDEEMAALAGIHGIATWYEDTRRQRVEVADEVVVAVLAEFGVDAGSPAARRAALAWARSRPAGLPDPLVLRQGDRPAVGVAELTTEDGAVLPVADRLPGDLPLGWHRLSTQDRESSVVVTPARLPAVRPSWGWQVQLYALHSPDSWGIGDLADLRSFVTGAAGLGAGVVLVNPVQAITPVSPVERSPYSPTSRRFANPLTLRVTETDAFRRAGADTRRRLETLAPHHSELIDYDAVWAAKLAALELLWPGGPVPADPELCDFATFCALAERHGPDWRTWPVGLRHPANPEVAAARRELADRIAFHAWLQELCAKSLGEVRQAARAAGVAVVHDLPVGVHPGGADAWMLRDVLAPGVTIGAPPDDFSPAGQDWNLPPWRPDRLAAAGYGPFRDVIRGVLGHADGIRVDHVAGLSRMWWIPPGHSPDRGTYVRYDADSMLGILALEAHRAGAMVIGEDLGTVLPEVTEGLHERGMLSSAVLWFQRDQQAPGQPLLAPERWPAGAMASISTHDLPTAAGFLRGEHVRVQAELGLLADPDAAARAAERERAELLAVLAEHGLTDEDPVVALHKLLATAASALLLISPQDALGDVRQPNLPGTVDQYPNWRIPLPVPVDKLFGDPRLLRAVAALREARPRSADGA
jgi:4-alpha-glucanotransferase